MSLNLFFGLFHGLLQLHHGGLAGKKPIPIDHIRTKYSNPVFQGHLLQRGGKQLLALALFLLAKQSQFAVDIMKRVLWWANVGIWIIIIVGVELVCSGHSASSSCERHLCRLRIVLFDFFRLSDLKGVEINIFGEHQRNGELLRATARVRAVPVHAHANLR